MHIGKVIKGILVKRAIKQRDFAIQIGVTEAAFSKIINGKVTPSSSTMIEISKHLNIPIGILYFLTVSEEDIPDEKKEMFKIIGPSIKQLISQVFSDQELSEVFL